MQLLRLSFRGASMIAGMVCALSFGLAPARAQLPMGDGITTPSDAPSDSPAHFAAPSAPERPLDETPPSVDAIPSISVTPMTGGSNLSPQAKADAENGIESLSKSKFAAAETAFLDLLKRSPGNPSALVNLGLIEFRLGHNDDAQKYLKEALRVRPDAALAWMMSGVIDMDAGNLEAATASLAQAVYLSPKNPAAHNYFAVTLAKRGWYDAAEDELQQVVTLAPTFSEAQYNLALIYYQRNPPAVELARRHYQKAMELGAQPDKDFEAKLKAAPKPDEVQ